MSKIDDRIVNMKFNNAQFEKGIADTTKSLFGLKNSLSMPGAAKGLEDVDAASRKLSFAGLANAVQDIANKFNALSVIGVTALANIANKAVNAGLQLANSLTIAPIRDGLAEYELMMGSIQTMLANTERYGTKLPEVMSNLDELNDYADKTIYNFGEMTKNIGLFTNAGIQIGDATQMIKGFSNVAAASGTSSQGAAGAAYQLSQALSAGTIRLMDWRSLTNVGMGNKNMQQGLIEIADAMGTLEANTITAEEVQGDFNGSLEKNWLSADVMSNYLKIMAGDMDDASMAALGLSDAQIQAFKAQQKTAEEAATKVRTWTQLVGTMQEAVGSGWSETFRILIGDFDQATELWTNVNNALGPIIDSMSDARNNMLKAWAEGGGRDSAIAAVANAWNAAKGIIMPIKEAFQEIFPPMTAQQLINITKAVENFTKSLIPTETQMQQIKSTFKGVFAVIDIGRMIFVEVIKLFGRLFGVATQGAGGILAFTGAVGDWLVKVRDAIKNGEGLGDTFKKIGDTLQVPIDYLRKWGKALIGFFKSLDYQGAWEKLSATMKKFFDLFKPKNMDLGGMDETKKKVEDFFKNFDFNILVGLMNVGALTGIGVVIKLAVDKILGIFQKAPGDGLFSKIKGSFDALTDTLGSMQDKLRAEALVKIGIAIGILAGAVLILSFIDPTRLGLAVGAITALFANLAGTMVLIENLMKVTSGPKMAALAGSMVLMGGAMILLAAGVKMLADLDWEGLAKGLIGVGVGFGIFVGAMALMSKIADAAAKDAPKMGALAFSMILMATAVVILAGGMKIFASLSWDDIGRAGTLLVGTLGTLLLASKLAQKAAAGSGPMFILSGALLVLGAALTVMAAMSWDEIGRAVVTLAGSLVLMVGAVAILSSLKGAPVGVGVMLGMAIALNLMLPAFKAFSEMSWEEIGKSMVMLGGSLVILGLAMALMGAGPVALGALALAVASVGLMLLAPALKMLGEMSWDEIGRGLAMLAASLAIMAVLGLLMIPASVGFLLTGTAILLLGAGILLAAQGIAIFVTAFAGLVGLATVGGAAIAAALLAVGAVIPQMMQFVADGIIQFAVRLAEGATEFTNAAVKLMKALIQGFNEVIPDVLNTLWNLAQQGVQKIRDNIEFFVTAGLDIILGFLRGVNSRMGQVIDQGTVTVVKFLNGIGRNASDVANAGVDMIISFVRAIAGAINSRASEMRSAGRELASAILNGMTGGLWSGIEDLANAAAAVAQRALGAAKRALGINSPSKEFFKLGSWSTEGLANGLSQTTGVVDRAATGLAKGTLATVAKNLAGIGDGINLQPVIRPVLDLTNIKRDAPAIEAAMPTKSLVVSGSYEYAAAFAESQRSESFDNDSLYDGRPGDTIVYNQTINSPKAVSEAETYRNTKNLLTTIKGEKPI